jgi:hypothetical protein
LKKRTKKLLDFGWWAAGSARDGFKSFLVLFLKKEMLSFLFPGLVG